MELSLMPGFGTKHNEKREMRRELSLHRHQEHMRKCSKCEFVSKVKGDYTKHILQAHKVPLVFPCPECDYKAKTQENLHRYVKFIVHRDNSDIHSID